MVSFANDDATKPNVLVDSNGLVKDVTSWSFRQGVRFDLERFPFDRQSFKIVLGTLPGVVEKQLAVKLRGPQYIIMYTQSETEWSIVKDFEKIPSNEGILVYQATIKRYPYFWGQLIIIPCFILGFFVLSALTLGADSNSIESLVNIGLAASVSSAVIISAMTDHFPKTEHIPNIAEFVRNQFIIIATVLITLSIRKAIKPKVDAAVENWEKPENEMSQFVITLVKILKHRLLLFVIFVIAYMTCFAVMLRNVDHNFTRKDRKYKTGYEDII